MTNPYELASAFAMAFGELEYALKRSGHLRQGRDAAAADWDTFARSLGPHFFVAIVESGIAKTLIGVPPRRLIRNLEWAPEIPVPLTNVHELILNGVCRVRNSYLHGEKFTGGPDGQWERDAILVKEAHAVLNEAIAWWLYPKA
jgi:hypothetical protein